MLYIHYFQKKKKIGEGENTPCILFREIITTFSPCFLYKKMVHDTLFFLEF